MTQAASLKVVMVVGRSTGGIGTHVAQLSANLRERGVEVIVVTHPLTAGRFDLGPVRLWWPGSAGWARAARDLMRLRRLASTSDIVHAHGHQAALLATLSTIRTVPRFAGRGPTPSLGLPWTQATRGSRGSRGGRGGQGRQGRQGRHSTHSGPKLVVTQHNAVLAGSGRLGLKRLAQRWVARHTDLATGVSRDLVQEAVRLGATRAELAPVPAPKVPDLLAEQAADAPTRARLRATQLGLLAPDQGDDAAPADPALPLVVTISRIAPQKNLPVLVAAASQLRTRCIWVVLGDGEPELLAQLRSQVRSAGAPVQFVGARSDADRWLRAAEVFVLPSTWEGQPLVVQEAMAAGTPVVATDVGGLHDMLAGTGLLVTTGNAQQVAKGIAQATDRVLTDPALREQLAARGREAAAALPDGPETASRWLAWYAWAIQMT